MVSSNLIHNICLIFLLLPITGVAQSFLADSLQTSILPSPNNSISLKADSISVFRKDMMDYTVSKFNHKADSLKNITSINTSEYLIQIDSLYKGLSKYVDLQILRTKQDTIDAEVSAYLNHLDSLVHARKNLMDSLLQTNSIAEFSSVAELQDGLKTEIPDGIKMNDPEGINSLGIGKLSVPDYSISVPVNADLGTANMPNVTSIDQTKPIGGLSDLVQQGEQYTSVVEDVTHQTDKIKVEDKGQVVDEIVNAQLLQIKELKALQEQQLATDKLAQQAETLKAMQQEPGNVKQMIKKHTVDYLAGKEELVQNDLDDIAKVQLKYRNVTDSRDLPRRLPNEMKGKPFRERIIPGISLQVIPQNNITIEFAPIISYRITGRWLAGAGGFKRITYFEADDALKGISYYGLRLFSGYRMIKSLHVYSEWGHLKTSIKNASNGSSGKQNVYPDWISKWNFGMLNRYKIGKGFNVHFLFMYDLLKIKKFPNTEGAATRFGFDYQFKKEKSKR